MPKREFRGVWVATVANIDWPSKAGLPTAVQQREFRELLDFHQANGMNAIVMQVRPSADAFYYSKYEPWSQWLTGKQGRPPVPYYDPLAFMIEEAHQRGMEFHAWFNPYRAVVDVGKTVTDSFHITRQRPEWFVTYGDRQYFDPGIPAVRQYITEVIRDVVLRYDIDAVHFDDYFYPYKIAGLEFPDSASFKQYGAAKYSLENKDDWRRSNVDTVIMMLGKTIRDTKPWVQFGISPFAVWRNQDKDPLGSATKAGQTNYDDLYADILKWMRERWIDYVVPQLYFPRGFGLVDYGIMLDWWALHSYGRHVYVGQGVYRLGNQTPPQWKDPAEMPAQLRLNRAKPEVKGSVYFSAKSFKTNPLGINDSLKNDFYRHKALLPTLPWLDNVAPLAPDSLRARSSSENGQLLLTWKAPADVRYETVYYAVYKAEGKNSDIRIDDPAFLYAAPRTELTRFEDRRIEPKNGTATKSPPSTASTMKASQPISFR